MSSLGANLMRKFNNVVLLSLTVIFCLVSAVSAVAQTTVLPTSVAFGNEAVGAASVARSVSLTNTQAVALTINSITVSGAGYALVTAPSAPCANPGTLPAGKTCYIRVSLTPSALGAAPAGMLTFTTNATNSPQSISLSGKGVAPLTLSPAFFAFGATSIGGTSPTKILSVTNVQASAISLTSVGFTGPFSLDTSANTTCPQAGGTVSGSLAAGATCAIGVVFKPTVAGSVTGQLTLNDGNSVEGAQSIPVSGFGGSEVVVSPLALAFGNVAVGTTSAAKSITLLNGQSVNLHFSSISAPAPYAIVPATTTCLVGTPVAPNSSCVINVTFSPTAVGSAPVAAVTFNDDSPNTPQSAGLTGSGAPPVTLLPTQVSFGNVVVGQTSALKTVTLVNNLATTLNISSLAVTAGTPYAIDPTSTCLSPTLGAGLSCTVALTVTPTALGAQPAGTLTATFSASNSPQTVSLGATGIAPVTLTPASLSFGSLTLGLTSTTKTLTLANNQTSGLSISGSVFNGPFALDTSATTTCPIAGGVLSGTLAGGTSCVVGVQFKPITSGATVGGQITILDNAPNSPQIAGLSGTGVISVQLLPGTVAFGNVAQGTTSAPQTVTLKNNQTVALNFSSIAAPAPFAIVPATTTCVVGTPVVPGGSCNISVSFAPTSLGVAPTSVITVSNDAPSTPQTANLTGVGVGAVTLSPAALGFGTVVVGQAAEKNVTLTNNQSVALSITSLIGLPAAYSLDATNTTCQQTPLTVPPNTSCVFAVSLTATAKGAQPGTVTVNFGGGLPSQSFGLTANAIQPVLVLPTALAFASQFVGAQSAPQSVTVTNEQNIALSVTSATITGNDPNDFTITTNTCPIAPATLPALTPCGIQVVFSPTASGNRSATLNINDDALGTPQTVSLLGAANAPVTISPQSITNYIAPVGTTSAFKTFTITNAQTATTLHFTNLKLIGDYIQSSTTCPIGGAGIAPGATCTLAVQFNPSIGGVRTGQLQVYDDAITSPQVVNLSGTGTSPLTISPSGLGFSAQTVGTSSAAKTITLTNHEVQQETFTLSTTGDFTANSNCTGGIIAANSSCFVYVTFTPSSVLPSTTRTGTLTIANAAAGTSTTWVNPVTAPLTGSATATNPKPAVSVVAPGAGAAGTTVNVVITGNGWTHFSSSSVISFSDINSGTYPVDITVQSFTAVNANTIDATLVLAANTVANPVTYGARNIKIVTPLSGGGSETAPLISAFIIADPNNQHTLTSITPAFGIQGQTLNVALTATGTNFSQGVTYANFGDGISINSLTVLDATDALANISISNTTYVGYRTITLVTGGEFATSGAQAFQIGPNAATLTGVTLYSTATSSCTANPVVAPQGFSGAVCLTATGSHFLESATQVAITGGVLVGDVQVTSPTTAIAQIAVQASATIGLQNVTVSTGGEISTLNNSVTVTGATPLLLSVVPSSGVQGTSFNVVITGNSFTNFVTGQISATFDGNITSPTVNVITPNQVSIPITISNNANVGTITAHLLSGPAGNVTIFPFSFTVTPSAAAITSVTPSCVPQGGQLTLTIAAINTNWVQGTTTAGFYPVPVPAPSFDEITISDATDALLNVAVPTNTPAGAYGFWMATGGQIVNASVNVCAATPTLTMNPANGLLPSGAAINSFAVSFTGQFTKWGPTTVPVISGEGVSLTGFTVTGNTSAIGTINIIGATNGTPTATGARLVTFTTGGEIDTTYFNVTKTPVAIISVSPYHAPQSVTLDVAITGLNTHFESSSGATPTQVLFGPQVTVNSVSVTDATHLTVNITTSYLVSGVPTPTPAGWDAVYVNTGSEQLIAGFLIDSPALPSLVSVCVTGSNPCVSSAQQGATVDVTITGSLTNWVQNTTQAILGAGVTVANLTITGPTTATATIAVLPTAPVGGNSVIMITGNQIVSGTGFSVTPNAALISSIGPAGICNSNAVTIANFCGISGGTGTPYVIGQLQTATLNIVGVGTHWLQGYTTVNFGPGVAIDLLTVSSPTTAQVQITVLSTSPIGYAPLTTITGGEVVTLQQAIDIEEGFPTMLATSPGGEQQGDTFNLQVLGRFTSWGPTTSAAFNQDITVNSVNVVDPDNLILNVTVSPWAYVDYSSPCGHVLTVTTGTQQVVGSATAPGEPGIFCVSQGAEEITSVSPLQTIQGSTVAVTILGSATNFLAGVTHVSFGDPNFAIGQIQVNSPTSLTVPVAVSTAATPGFKTVTVSTYGQVASQQYSFTVSPSVATLNEAIPNQAEQGAPIITSPTCSVLPYCTVRLLGQYSHFSNLSTATFGAGITVQSVTWISATEVDAQITIDPLSYPGGRLVTVTTPGVSCAYQPPVAVNGVTYAGCTPGVPTGTGSEIVSNYIFSIIPGPAIISSITPATGNEGQEIIANITGLDTHWAQNFTQFYISGGGYDITINSVVINSPTSATVDLSISPTANPGARSIYMVTNGESLTDSGAFVVTGGVPVITYLYPNSATPGTNSLKVTVHGLYTLWAAGSTTVNFGPGITVVPGSFQVDDTTHLEALINIDPAAQLGYRTVQVTTTGLPAGTQILTGNFLVQAPPPPPTPYIWYENPSSGIPGQTLTINFYGQYTQWNPDPVTGTILAGFNADVTVDNFQVTSPTSAYATVTVSPTATSSYSTLTLTTPGTTNIPSTEVDYAAFSVVVAQPTLSVVDPGAGMQGSQNLIVNIIGQFTAFDSTTTFNFGQGVTTNGPPTILGPTIATQSISIAQLANLGGRSVVSSTPDATTANQVTVGGAGFSVTPSLALILSVTPNTAQQGNTVSVVVTGQNTHWNGSTTFQFGAGIVVTSTSVTSNTTANLTLAIPAYAPEGPTNVQATTLGEIATLNNGFVVQAGTPYLLSSGPGSEPQQGSAVFTILSQATNWSNANPPVVSYGPGIDLTNVNVTGPTSMTVDGYVEPTAAVGWRNLTVTTGSQTLGLNYAVYVTPGPAVINSVSPNTGGQGVNLPSVTITGTNTHWVQGTTTLNFPDVLVNSWSVTSPTTITANITVNASAPAGQVSVTATTLGEVATGSNVFTITQTQPELLAVVPSSGAQGATKTITLTGQYTSFNTAAGCSPNCTTANFGTGITVNSVTALSTTSLQANITISPTTTLGYRNVSVTSGSQVVSMTNAFNVTVGPAAIVALLNPDTGPQGASNLQISIQGSQTHWAQGTTTASFGGGINVTGLTITDALDAVVTISIPNGTPLGAYNVSLTTGGEVATELGAFTVTTGSPYLSAVNPPTGHQGDAPFNVTLTGQFTHFNTAAGCSPCSTANFGAGIAVNTLNATSATSAVANITISPTATIASRNVSVVTGPETASITGGFSVLAGVPAITTIVPTFGQAGTTLSVVVNGQFTTFQAGFSTVSFGSGVTVNFISGVTTTQLTANITVASNATVGTRDVSVTTNGTTLTLSGGFAVTAGTPAITQISPNFGNPGQTALTVTITGQYTNWTTASTVTIGTPADGITVVGAAGPGLPGPVVTATATTVTVSINIDAAAPLGPAGVSVTTGGSTQSIGGGFTVQAVVIPAPSLISLSPGANAGGIPTNSQFIAVFSQPMNRTTFTNNGTSGTVILYLTSNQGQGWIPVPVTINVDATGRVLTITPNALLAVNSTYYLNLTSGIKDATAAGNSINNYAVYLYTVFSANTTAPTVVAANPPALSTVGTNVPIQLEFSTDMNQDTASGMTVTSTGGSVAGTFTWNSYPYGSPYWGPGNVLYFTPTTALAANTTYTVSYGAPLADTAGNALTPGSFTFTTGSGTDTAQNYTGSDIANGLTNVGTNVAPMVTFSKPINPLDINTSNLLMYNYDSGKYINGTVTVAPNGLSATFTPSFPLLPNTYYRLYQAWGNFDADGNYLNGTNTYFTTGAGADLVAPDVASISPTNTAMSVPLNAEVIVHFNSPIDPAVVSNIITVTPSGGSAISGSASLASDLVTLFFTPTSALVPATTYAVQVSGYQDVVGNVGTTRSYSFTTATSIAPLNISTGFNASGQLITTNDTDDANWSYIPQTGTPSESTFGCPSSISPTPSWCTTGTSSPLQTVGPGDAGWWGSWAPNGPNSDWITINPASTSGNTYGLYYSTFNISGSVPANLCLVGRMGIDDNGLLAINGTAIMGNLNLYGGGGFYGGYQSLYPLNIPITSYLATGTNVLSLGWGSTDNSEEGFRLQATIQTCGASITGGLSLLSATPANQTSNVATNTTITLVFSNSLDPATVGNSTLPVMVGWNGSQQIHGAYVLGTTNVGNDTVVFTPDTPFPVSSQIWVGAVNGPYDLAGDSASNGSNYTQLTYFNTGTSATAATTPFAVLAFAPTAGATNVGLRAPVVATFNRSLNINTVNSNDYALFVNDGQSPWCGGGNYSRSQDGTSIAFNCGALPSSATMTAFLGSGLQDWNGDALTPSYSSQFTTSYYDSNTNGSVISTRPGNGAGSVNANLPIVFYTNLPINAGSANAGLEVAQNNVAVPGTVNVTDNGYTLIFTPSVPWTPGSLIQWWTTGSLIDTTYDTNFNSASGYFYVAASTATLTPSVQVASPSSYTNPVPLNTIFDLQFNTPLNATAANGTNIYLYDSNNNLNVPATFTMPQPNEVRIVPNTALPANDYIYVEITTGVQSTTSVPATATSWWERTGTATDSTLPTVTSAVPYSGATNIGVNEAPGVIISKAIDPVSVNANTFQLLNGGTPLAGTFWFNSGDTRVEFVPNAPLPINTLLTMSLNGVLDTVGNPVTFSSTFTTGSLPDISSPSVDWTSVSYGESIPTNSAITIQFSESMDATSFNTSNIYIYDSLLGVTVPATLTWNSTQTVAYLAPTSVLSAGREYYLYANSGTDLAGNQVNSYFAVFYAELASATTAPTVVNFNPIGGSTGLGTNAIIEAQFSAPIDPNFLNGVTLSQGGSTVTTSTSLSAANTVLQLIPAVPLQPNTTYVMTIAGAKDPAGNTVATVTNSFTTGPSYDISPPTWLYGTPMNYSTVGTNTLMKLGFSKPLNPITVNSSTFQMYLYDTGQWIPTTIALSPDGTEVTMTPQIPLLPNTEYRFDACCSFQDENGNNGNGGTNYFWTNGGAVSSGPTVSVSPVNGATNIPLNAEVIVSVSSVVDFSSVGNNNVQLFDSSNALVAGTQNFALNSGRQQFTFVPAAALQPSMTYTVKVSGFTDQEGNAVVPSTTTFTTGSTAATAGLTLTSQSIPNGSTITNSTQQICMTFSQILDPATLNLGTVLVMNSWNGNWGLAGTYTVGGTCGATPVGSNTIVYTPANPYPPGAQIYVGITGGLTDVLGDAYGGNASSGLQNAMYFYMATGSPDTSALTVISVSPASGATNVRPDTPVSITFNKGINPYSVYNNNNNALLFAGQGLQDRGSISMSPDNRTLTFNSGVLYQNATYTIELPAGGISDPSGNTLTVSGSTSTPFVSTFTTGGNPASGNGSVQSEAPGNNARSVPTDSLLTLYMNRQVNPSTLPGQLTVTVNGAVYAGNVQAAAGGYEIQFTPTVPFPYSATVQWFLSGSVLDVYGDAFNGNSGVFYIVAAAANPATAIPTVIAVSPTYSSASVPVNAEMDVEYSQPVAAASLANNVVLYSWGTSSYQTVTISQPAPNIVRLTPASPLTPSTQYGICTNSSVQGTNGVNAQGDCWAAVFNTVSSATADATSGTVTIGPPDGSATVGTNAYVRFWFSKAVDTASINSSNMTITTGGNTVPGTWSWNYTNSDVREINFSPVNPLPPSSTITVSVNPASATSNLLDYAGNAFTAATANFTTTATPDYSTPSVTLDFGYWQPGVATNASFTCHYTEPMDPSSVTASNTYIYSYVNNGNVPVNFTWSTDLMSVTMTPTTPLFANSQYIYYCNSAIDLTGNGQSNGSAGFYTASGPDSTGPVLVSANPPNGSTGVPLNTIGGPWNNTSLMLLFNEPVATESMASITFTPAGGSAEPIAVYPEDGNYIADVQLPWALLPGVTYTFNVAGVTDISGNPASGTTTSSFTTGTGYDWSQPTVASTVPANGTTLTGVPASVSVTFNEAMNPTLITSSQIYLQTHNTNTIVPVTVSISPDSTTVTLTPTTPLAESTIYDLSIYGNNWWPYDVAGNSLNLAGYAFYDNGYVFSEFTTGTTAAVNGACGTANGSTFSIPPTSNLCSSGNASGLTNVGGAFSWSCSGQYGGTAASCSATVTPANACYPQSSLPASSLVSWWKGDDDATDHMGNNNGTLENGTGFAVGAVNDAFSFNGSNQYVLIGQPVPTDLQIQNNFSMSAWIYVTNYPANVGSGPAQTIFGSEDGSTHAGIGLYLFGSDNYSGITPGSLDLDIGNGSSWYTTYSSTAVPLNQWVLITVTATANHQPLMYYNGVLQPVWSPSSETVWNGTVSYSGSTFAIGQTLTANYAFNGLIDEVQIYNAALTTAQVQGIFNAGGAGVCP